MSVDRKPRFNVDQFNGTVTIKLDAGGTQILASELQELQGRLRAEGHRMDAFTFSLMDQLGRFARKVANYVPNQNQSEYEYEHQVVSESGEDELSDVDFGDENR